MAVAATSYYAAVHAAARLPMDSPLNELRQAAVAVSEALFDTVRCSFFSIRARALLTVRRPERRHQQAASAACAHPALAPPPVAAAAARAARRDRGGVPGDAGAAAVERRHGGAAARPGRAAEVH